MSPQLFEMADFVPIPFFKKHKFVIIVLKNSLHREMLSNKSEHFEKGLFAQ